MLFDPGLVGLFITSTLLHLGEDINLLVLSHTQPSWAWLPSMLDPSQFGSLSSPTLYGSDTLLSMKLRRPNTPLDLELHNPDTS